MLFQILQARSGAIVFQTEHESCVPDKDTIKSLETAGYKIKKSASGKIIHAYRDWDALDTLSAGAEAEDAKAARVIGST